MNSYMVEDSFYKRRASSPGLPLPAHPLPPQSSDFPAAYNHPSDFFLTPPTTSEAASIESVVGSPGDWSNFSWLPPVPFANDVPLIAGGEQNWAWLTQGQQLQSMQEDVDLISNGQQLLPSSIDPSALFKAAPAQHLASQANHIPTTHPLSVSFSRLPSDPVAFASKSHQWNPSQATLHSEDDIRGLVDSVLASSRISSTTAATHSQPLLPDQVLPPRSQALPLPKPDLGTRPPLAKHVNSTTHSSASSPSSTPGYPSQEPDMKIVIGTSGRPKTSHTTIERRYRTNLNARILMLRRSVPALRVLEKDENRNPLYPDDIIDERGFVDGVRAARKASKASILGKAAEYIHVLKKREHRLRHEALGLRVLITSLDGGGQLLEDFDVKWRSRYGGEEADEVHDLSDADDGDDDCSEDEQAKPRKKARPDSSTASNGGQPNSQPGEALKRKRGRPRKTEASAPANAKAPRTEPIPMSDSQEPTKTQTAAPQYLLGAFLFFSFFRSPTDYPSTATQDQGLFGRSHHHVGAVLSHYPNALPAAQESPSGYTFTNRLVPWSSSTWSLAWLATGLLVVIIGLRLLSRAKAITGAHPKRPLAQDVRPLKNEQQAIIRQLNIGGLVFELYRMSSRCFLGFTTAPESDRNIPTRDRLLQLELLISLSTSSIPSSSTMLNLYSSLRTTAPSMANFSLAVYPLSPIIAKFIWRKAARVVEADQYSHLYNAVLAMDVHEAYFSLAERLANGATFDSEAGSAMDILAETVVINAASDLVSDTFIRTVRLIIHPGDASEDPLQDRDIVQATRWLSDITTNPKSIGRDIVALWEEFMKGKQPELLRSVIQSSKTNDVRDLVDALHLLRASFITPSGSEAGLSLSLRRALAAAVFTSAPELEDARDSLIDILY